MLRRLPLLVLAILLLAAPAYTYIPAVNSTAQGVADTEDSTITLKWPSGTFQETISYQLAANVSMGISKGALVRVREEDLKPDDYTWQIATPWVALINCDRNGSGVSMVDDIFTLVRDRGAIAALLYSNHSEACRINDGYKFGEFERVIDIFTTKKTSTATLIQSQFNSVNYNYTYFNPKLLNDSAAAVNASIALNAHDISPYVIASLRAWNATGTEDPNDPASTPTPIPIPNGNNGASSNRLAMIVLYVVTGSVSVLFVIVILTGAVRAFRHPERYGPRAYDPHVDGPEGEGQTRALGIARAVLDTFPVIKWARNNNNPPQSPRSYTESKTSQGYDDANRSSRSLESERRRESAGSDLRHRSLSGGGSTSAGAGRPSRARGRQGSDLVDPAAIGRETCPICIVDFEEGDDVRVLPCPGHHRFHKDCVDPWLLELSTSCPICREDFQALEEMAMAQEEDQAVAQTAPEPAGTSTYPPQHHSSASRFTKYMSFVQRKRQNRGLRPPSETNMPQ